MRIGIVVVTDRAEPNPIDLLRAEYLSAAIRQARHKPRCLLAQCPIDPQSFESQLRALDSHLLLFYVSPHVATEAGDLSDLAYRQNPDRPQFLVGPWATIAPRQAVKSGPVNGLLRGEAELSIGKLLNSLADRDALKKVPGLWLRRGGGEYYKNDPPAPPQPDQIPVPDFSGFEWPTLAAKFSGTLPAEASRGSRLATRFGLASALRLASPPEADDHYFRLRPVSDVLRDINSARMRFDPLRLVFVDEVFPDDPDWLVEFGARLKTETNLPFSARLTADHHSGEALEVLADAGLTTASLGLVCGDPGLRASLINYNADNDQIAKFVDEAHAHNVRVVADVVVGFPFETREHMQRTHDMLRDIPFDAVHARTYVPVPGSALYRTLDEKGLIDHSRKHTTDSLVRSNVGSMEISYFAERIYRLNLEKQAADYAMTRGYWAAIPQLAGAQHSIRRIELIEIQRRRGEPAFAQTVPAESSFPCFIRQDSMIVGEVEMIESGGAGATAGVADRHARILAEISFTPDGGAPVRIFSARLGSRRTGKSARFAVPLRMNTTTQGTLSLSVRDAGGGDGLQVAWINPLLAPREGITEPTVEVKVVDPDTGEIEVVHRGAIDDSGPSDGDGAIPDSTRPPSIETRAAPALKSGDAHESVDAVASSDLQLSADATEGAFLVEPSRAAGASDPRHSLDEHARVDQTAIEKKKRDEAGAGNLADSPLGFGDQTAVISTPSEAEFAAARSKMKREAFPSQPSSGSSEFRISEFPIPPSGVVSSDHDTSSPELSRDLATPPPEDIPAGALDEVERLRARCSVLERDLHRRVERIRNMADRIKELEAEVKRLGGGR